MKNGAIATLAVVVAACGGSKSTTQNQTPAMAQALFVATTAGTLESFDVASGQSRGGEVTGVLSPVDLQGLPEGYVGLNLSAGGASGLGEVLFVDARTMLEKARFASSLAGSSARRPVHSYLSPVQGGKRVWLSLNDGASPALADPVAQAATNSALLVDVTKGSATYMKPFAEVPLGLGHHKAGFSASRQRVVVTNISECNKVVQVVDYSDPAAVTLVKTWSAADLGWDGSTTAKTCGTASGQTRPTPHGCATAATFGHVYCNLTGDGEILSVDVDADPPSLQKVSSGGKGAGATMAHPNGWFVFTAHNTPREDATTGQRANQIGSLSIVDTRNESVDGVPTVTDIPLFYDGPNGTRLLVGTDEELLGISHVTVSLDGKYLFVIPSGGGFTPAPGYVPAVAVADQRARKVLVLDVSDPANPVQKPSIDIGLSKGDNSDALSGDGKLLFVTNNAGSTVSAIDTATLQVVRTFTVPAGSPKVVATFGDAEGCSKPVH
ncbi:MAG: YncE family protein [Anaeromyxobacteraceae bacterium]